MSKLPCCMNINALNEDNLCFIRKVLEQVPSLKSHSVDFLLYESRHNAIFPLKSTFPTWSRFFFPFFTDRRKEGGKNFPLLWNQTFKGFIQHINQRWERREEEEEAEGGICLIYTDLTRASIDHSRARVTLPRGAAGHIDSWGIGVLQGWMGCGSATMPLIGMRASASEFRTSAPYWLRMGWRGEWWGKGSWGQEEDRVGTRPRERQGCALARNDAGKGLLLASSSGRRRVLFCFSLKLGNAKKKKKGN